MLWFWTKVVLVLALTDVLLFRVGLFWDLELKRQSPTQLARLHDITRAIDTHEAGEPVAVAVGSSVVRMSGPDPAVNRRLARLGAETSFRNLGLDAAHVDDSALVNAAVGTMDPWLVIYGVAFRDFMPRDRPSRTESQFAGLRVPLSTMQPETLDERLARFLRAYWTLYRYRDLVRHIVDERFASRAWRFPRQAHARPDAQRSRVTRAQARKTQLEAGFGGPKSFQAWERWNDSRDFSDYEAYLKTRGGVAGLYRKRRAAGFELATSPQLEALDWLLRVNQERGSRVVLIYYPENPVFRDPAASGYFSPELSDEVAAVLERKAARYGARFVDLRQALQPEDFIDMVHPNRIGTKKLMDSLAQIIAQEWVLENEAAATSGAIPP